MSDQKVRWGVLGAANIALKQVIPAMQQSALVDIVAIASRDDAKSRAAAQTLGIPKAYGSYEELLADGDVDAIYNPLPNHLHVPWSIKAARAGKHVLCEKPIGLNAAEVRELLRVRDETGVQICEAFMVRSHPQWHAARERVRSGEIGDLRFIAGHFSYFKIDPTNVRNVAEWGGGGLMDIGCYPITMSRYLFGTEPERVVALMDRDPDFQVDRLTSALLQFPQGQATFTCATQLAPFQRMHIFGTTSSFVLDMPFNPTPEPNQFTLQADAFSRAVLGVGEVPVPLEDSVRNMRVIDALFRSSESGGWEQV